MLALNQLLAQLHVAVQGPDVGPHRDASGRGPVAERLEVERREVGAGHGQLSVEVAHAATDHSDTAPILLARRRGQGPFDLLAQQRVPGLECFDPDRVAHQADPRSGG